MPTNYSIIDPPPIIKEYLTYIRTVQGKSERTAYGYYHDLRTFFRFVKLNRKLVEQTADFEKIPIDDVNLDLVKSVTLTECYEFMNFSLSHSGGGKTEGNKEASRNRKTIALRRFYAFLTQKMHYFEHNPVKEMETPKVKKALPKYLTLEQSLELLDAVDGKEKERDYLLLTIMLNCGLRLSEVFAMNYQDFRSDNTLRVVGKGNKERIVYLNDSCIAAYKNYMKVRPCDGLTDPNALFISQKKSRLCLKAIENVVYKYLDKIGLSGQGYSCHKLRHTAATLMYQHGNVDIRVLQDILGHENLGTTQIYTHLSSTQMQDAANANPLAKVNKSKNTEKKN
ncbi:MAG: tyrosine-type recombinase/integrase [Oscillospiraceae bacterium]|jgi:site-specific recombinase XerD|nr:tyrosine-type recombinase/integrase [Oscillospiraceae bacterium]